jgi:His-Xaa-Ser system radical SAM maturase HxsB
MPKKTAAKTSRTPAKKPAPRAPKAASGAFEPAPHRFRAVGGQWLVTGDAGTHLFLTGEEFNAWQRGELTGQEPVAERLKAAGLVGAGYDEDAVAARICRRKDFLTAGPYLHIFVVSLRCNQQCVYCHASRAGMKATGVDMTPEVADRCLDLAFHSPSPFINVEFQGGEPLSNWDVVRHVVEGAVARNREARRELSFSLVTNLSLMDEAKLEYILDHGIQVCTSLDGPEALHNANRKWQGGNAYAETVAWMKRLNDGYVARGLDPNLYHVEALLTVTRDSLAYPREIVDEYVKQGLKGLFLRPLNPFGFAAKTSDAIGYGAKEFMPFYLTALDHILALNQQGVEIMERWATIFLAKILTDQDPNYVDIRSPCGAGVGQVAYNYDGQVFTCDEARMLYQMGDSAFKVGDAAQLSYEEIIDSSVVRSLLFASTQEALPACSECAYLPYCGTCPVYNYGTQGNIFGLMPSNQKCLMHMAIMDRLFTLLRDGGPQVRRVFERWTTVRERPYYIQHD